MTIKTILLILFAYFNSKQILLGSFPFRFLCPVITLDFSKRWLDFLRGGDALCLVNGVTSAAGAFLPDVSQGERIRATCEDYRVSALRYRGAGTLEAAVSWQEPSPSPRAGEHRGGYGSGGRSTALVGAEVASPVEGIRT